MKNLLVRDVLTSSCNGICDAFFTSASLGVPLAYDVGKDVADTYQSNQSVLVDRRIECQNRALI